jgi:hypothetical protein
VGQVLNLPCPNSRGEQNSLIAALSAAQQALSRGNPRSATKQLKVFADEVRALKRSHHLAANTADLRLLTVKKRRKNYTQ